jgi:polyisoprenoid-binding protein YceI
MTGGPVATSIVPGTYRLQPEGSSLRLHAAHAFGLGPVTGRVAIVDGTVAVEGTSIS